MPVPSSGRTPRIRRVCTAGGGANRSTLRLQPETISSRISHALADFRQGEWKLCLTCGLKVPTLSWKFRRSGRVVSDKGTHGDGSNKGYHANRAFHGQNDTIPVGRPVYPFGASAGAGRAPGRCNRAPQREPLKWPAGDSVHGLPVFPRVSGLRDYHRSCHPGADPASLIAHRRHERIHVRQYERWGVLFIPLYCASSLLQFFRGRDPYLENRFEREACSCGSCPGKVSESPVPGTGKRLRCFHFNHVRPRIPG